ncbi:hypothetical protein ACUWGD_13400 [Bacillus velezensis]
MLLHYFAVNDFPVSKFHLMQGIRLFNHNYKRFFGSKRKLAYLEDVEDVEVFHFFQCSFNCLKKSLERCLDDLVKRGLLIEEKSLIKVWRFRESMPSIATQDEVKIIKKIECSLLVEFNVTTKNDLMFTDKWPEFIDMLNKKLKEELYLRSYYVAKSYKHTCEKRRAKSVLSQEDMEFNLSGLNFTVCDQLYKNFYRYKQRTKNQMSLSNQLLLISKLIASKENKNWFERSSWDKGEVFG